jgi:hypothetical protein
MEACRPDGDDLAHPEMAPLAAQLAADPELETVFRRLQQADAPLGEAFGDVPVPDGLADRILARLAEGRADSPSDARPRAADPEGAGYGSPPEEVEPAGSLRRRWLLGGVGVGAVAASVAIAFIVFRPGAPDLTESYVYQQAMDSFEQDWDEPGQLVREAVPPGAFPADPEFNELRFPESRWRWAKFLNRKAVAYDLTPPGTRRATLYVVKCSVSGVAGLPPARPSHTTGNRSVAAWQTGEMLYVLVVEGGPRTYQNLLPQRTWT